ncbi:DUF4837 family protein [Mangrovimonas sp. YM274]|uniref:DUF4837 family protein n=1 Tax=Mangrovimonas sp. YM274 TaxID=3070660 RepID=UPI0027DCC4E1|nr:DUF4837 family protein [Mangrovimonas sp. YM274]WMI68945.1 DUF4837 family protein [Mangrovimonas sp. YM274]
MKHLAIVLVFATLVLGCKKDSSKNQRLVPASSGNLNHLTVVVDNLLWEDNVGEAMRDVLAAPVNGLAIDEPLFTINQLPTQVFSGFTTKSRIIVKVEKGKTAGIKVGHDVYAKPQTVVYVSGATNDEIIQQLKSHATEIVDALKKEEIKEKQRRINLSLFDDTRLKEELGVSMKLPSVYRMAKDEDGFFWIRKDITTGTMDLMVYAVPLSTLRPGDSLAMDVVKMRDSVGKAHIEGRLEGSYMITENKYAPFVFDTEIDKKPAIETKGIWEVKNDFMAGPFINYAIEDKAKNRYVIIEGYAFAPSVDKRDYMFELEAIIRSAKIQ